MTLTHTQGITYRSDAGQLASSTLSYTGDSEFNIATTIVGTIADKEYDIGSIVPANIQSMVLYCSSAAVVHTNTASTGTEDIHLAAGKMLVWDKDMVSVPKPFSITTTKLFVDVPAAVTATFRVSILLNDGV